MADSQVLKRLDFPAYCIKLLDNGLVALTGGGGTSKTGVGNSIELGFINYSNTHQAEFKLIHKFDSEDAIMKFVSFTSERPNHSNRNNKNSNEKDKTNSNDLYIAAAVNQTIEIYKIQPNVSKISSNDLIKQETNNNNKNLINRKKSTSQNGSTVTNNHKPANGTRLEAGVSIKLVNVINLNSETLVNTSDKQNQEDSIITIQVYKSKKQKQTLLCAGTSKGNVVIWSLLFENNNNVTNNKINFEKIHEFKDTHSNEIDDLQVNSEGLLLSIGKDSKCFVFNLETMTQLTQLDYIAGLNNDKNLRIKHARFSLDSEFLYTTYIPRVRGGTKNLNSYIQRWSKTNDKNKNNFGYKVDKTIRIRNSIITCVQASKDGYFVCAGDCDGKIYLYDFEFNKLIDYKKQHSSVITDLVFYYDQEFDLKNITNRFDLNKFILTISIDRTLQLYKFLNLNLTNRFLFDLNKIKVNKNNLNYQLMNLFSCLSMNLFKFIFILIVFFVLFCYFFIHIE